MAANDPRTELYDAVEARRRRNAFYRSLTEGAAPLPIAARDTRSTTFRRVLEWARIDLGAVVVDSTAERLGIEGFRTDPNSLEGDSEAWGVWSAAGGPLQSQLAIVDALTVGDSFLVGERTDDGLPVLSAESSDTFTVTYQPGSRSLITQAAKAWHEGDELEGADYLTVFDADAVRRYTRQAGGAWKQYDESENPLGFIPVAHVRNRPKLSSKAGRSELAGLENDLARVNKLSADLLMLSEFSSYKVRYATGIEVEEDATGSPVKPFEIGPDRLLTSENDQAKFGTLDETSLDPTLSAVKTAVSQVAALSRTPLFYLTGDLVNLSGDALRAMDGQAVAKAKQRQLEFDEPFAESMRMLLRLGESALADGPVETMWTDPESRSYSELADGVTKLVGAGVTPLEQARIDMGYSSLERERMRSYAAQDAAMRRLEQRVSGATVDRVRMAGA